MDTMEALGRLKQTATFRNGALDRWIEARLGVIGCGNLGSRFAPEAVRAGATVWVCDPDIGEVINTGTQQIRPGASKVQSVIEQCEQIRAESASGASCDVRHVGVGVLSRCDVLIDCTDDARLALPLTEIANGLGKPMLRLALDGSGDLEMGRVLCSDGGNDGACQMCSYRVDDLGRVEESTPCPGQATPERPPTLAGGALGMTVAGLGLLQAQRLIAGSDMEAVWNREVIVDWTTMNVFAAELRRSQDCLSGHQRWELTEIPGEQITRVRDMFDAATTELGTDEITLEVYGHPLCLEVSCDCGQRQVAVGTTWASAPTCVSCGGVMTWETETQLHRFNRRQAKRLQFLGRRIGDLGFPDDGAMFVASTTEGRTERFVLTGNENSITRRS